MKMDTCVISPLSGCEQRIFEEALTRDMRFGIECLRRQTFLVSLRSGYRFGDKFLRVLFSVDLHLH